MHRVFSLLKVVLVDMADFDSEIDLSGLGASASDKADLQRMLAVEQQKAQFTAQVRRCAGVGRWSAAHGWGSAWSDNDHHYR